MRLRNLPWAAVAIAARLGAVAAGGPDSDLTRDMTDGALTLSLGLLQASPLKDSRAPVVKVYGAASGHQFVVTCTNNSDQPIYVYGWGRTSTRIDGKSIDRATPSGSTGRRTIQSGGSWAELIQLVDKQGVASSNPDPKAIAAHSTLQVTLTPGRHAVTFSCGGAWSTDLALDWN